MCAIQIRYQQRWVLHVYVLVCLVSNEEPYTFLVFSLLTYS